MKTRWSCRRCGLVQWRRAIKNDPKCRECKGVCLPLFKDNCNVCGRELINEREDDIGLCKACTG